MGTDRIDHFRPALENGGYVSYTTWGQGMHTYVRSARPHV